MKKLHAERLLQVARVLEELPKEKRFSLGVWNKCGSVACAIGWAASDPWFIRRGLKLMDEPDEPHEYYPCYAGEIEEAAAMEFFGLEYDQTISLFFGVAYSTPTKRNVIRRIKAFVKANT